MPAVIEIISSLEKTAVTKELLEVSHVILILVVAI